MDVSFEIPTNFVHINWKEALGQVGNDNEFLFEILDDLKNEIKEANDVITGCLKIHDFGQISRTAHKIGGSTKYLYCERLQYVSEKMYTLHRELIAEDIKFANYTALFKKFQELSEELLNEFELYKKQSVIDVFEK
jgi:HPt (histidine-containing phosphotransfer) domain-containing protein